MGRLHLFILQRNGGLKLSSKVAIVTTGGYYYSWPGGTRFYDWLSDFSNRNKQFVPHVVSWKPQNQVPDKVKDQFNNIHYRRNDGCDWGCYNFFIESLKNNDIENHYRYAIFCHDDILTANDSWPTKLVNYMDDNPEFELASLLGSYMERPESSCDKKNSEGFVKSFLSMCFIVRLSEFFFENNPFVTIPGYDQDIVGDSGCAIVQHNLWNIFGSNKIGSVFHEGVGRDKSVIDDVLCFKRGRVVRKFKPENVSSPENLSPPINFSQVLSQGWDLPKGKMAENLDLKIGEGRSGH